MGERCRGERSCYPGEGPGVAEVCGGDGQCGDHRGAQDHGRAGGLDQTPHGYDEPALRPAQLPQHRRGAIQWTAMGTFLYLCIYVCMYV